MPGFVFEELLRAGVPMVELDIVTPAACSNDELAVYVGVTGIIDTGSPACIVNAGVLPDYFFQEGIPSKSFWTLSGLFEDCRCATIGLWFREHWKAFAPPHRLPPFTFGQVSEDSCLAACEGRSSLLGFRSEWNPGT